MVLGERRSIGYVHASMDKFSCEATKAPSACIVGAGIVPLAKRPRAKLARPRRGVGSQEAC